MSASLGKKFEERFKLDWVKSFPSGYLIRLPDQMNGYKEISKNICDYIGYNYPYIYFIECKEHKGASIPFDNITQFDKLCTTANLKGAISGVVLWLSEKDKVLFIPIKTLIQLKQEGKKSVGLKALDEGYTIIEIPSSKLRTFMQSDYSVLQTFGEEMYGRD